MDKNEKDSIRPQLIQLPLELDPDIKQIYLTGAVGTFTNHDFRMIILNEKSVEGNNSGAVKLVRVGEYELIMSHSVAKEIYNWLGKAIDQFEEQIGEIKTIGIEKNKD